MQQQKQGKAGAGRVARGGRQRLMARLAGWLLAGIACGAGAQTKVPSEPAVPARADWAAAEDRIEVWLNPGLYSRHFDRDLNLRENNVGFGVELVSNRQHGLMLGEYRNSNDRSTRYIGYAWRPILWGEDDGLRGGLGVIVAAFDGYPMMRDGGWFPALLPVASFEYKRVGLNLTIVPGYKDRLHGAIALQAKIRVW